MPENPTPPSQVSRTLPAMSTASHMPYPAGQQPSTFRQANDKSFFRPAASQNESQKLETNRQEVAWAGQPPVPMAAPDAPHNLGSSLWHERTPYGGSAEVPWDCRRGGAVSRGGCDSGAAQAHHPPMVAPVTYAYHVPTHIPPVQHVASWTSAEHHAPNLQSNPAYGYVPTNTTSHDLRFLPNPSSLGEPRCRATYHLSPHASEWIGGNMYLNLARLDCESCFESGRTSHGRSIGR